MKSYHRWNETRNGEIFKSLLLVLKKIIQDYNKKSILPLEKKYNLKKKKFLECNRYG